MAEETHKPAAETEEVLVLSDVPESEKPTVSAKEYAPEPEAPEKPVAAVTEQTAVEERSEDKQEVKIPKSSSFKEESNVVSELPESQKKALDELKILVQEALNKHEFYAPPPVKVEKPKVEKPKVEKPKVEEENKADAPGEPLKTEEAPAEVAAVEVADAPEEPITEPAAGAPAPPAVEVKDEAKETSPPALETAVETVVVKEVVEKVAEVDEDGAKTVEAIKETIVEVSAPSAEFEEPTKPADEEVSAPAVEAEVPPPEEVSIWGIPLLEDDRSDVILLKFLRARDFMVKDAFTMFKNAVRWRKEFGIDALLDEDLKSSGLDKVVFMHGSSKKGHPVCYNVYGEFKDKELYQSTFSNEEKRKNFLKWRIQFLEKSILSDLDFSPTGVNTVVQVVDLKNSPGLAARDLRLATSQALQLLQDNYPELVAKQVFINVPWWYLAFNKVISPFLTQRSKSKFVFASPSRTADTLFKYIAPELVPVQYGGLSKDGESEFTTADPATEFTIKPASKHTVEFPVSEKCCFVWEVRVVGWDVIYGAEFVPETEGGYTVILQKSRKISSADETAISNSFKVGESGKIVLTIDNQSSKKKKLLYRSKAKPSSD